MKQNKGITLIALVITIIVLLILAGVAISTLTGDNGILTKAVTAKEKTEKAAEEEALKLDAMGSMDENGKLKYNTATTVEEAIKQDLPYKNNTKITDEYGNKITVPAGFKIIKDNPADPTPSVKDGIIIQDATYEGTIGSEFVWIPVGNIKTSETETVTINLSRYTFNGTTGEETEQGSKKIDDTFTEDTQANHNSDYENAIATDIEDFKLKASAERSGGYYIGRYEARVDNYDTSEIVTSNSENETNWTGYKAQSEKELKLVTKPNSQVWNYVTQNKASELSKNMYTGKTFTSDLMNSYAWDTAIVFIQKCSDETKYSRQNSLNNSLANTGTNNLSTNQDIICNIWDMASNCWEWTTETSSSAAIPCVCRGGIWSDSKYYTAYHSSGSTTRAVKDYTFRPLLYL